MTLRSIESSVILQTVRHWPLSELIDMAQSWDELAQRARETGQHTAAVAFRQQAYQTRKLAREKL